MSSQQGPRAAGMRTAAMAFSRRHPGGKDCTVLCGGSDVIGMMFVEAAA